MNSRPDTGPLAPAPVHPPSPVTNFLRGELDRAILAPSLFLACLVIILSGIVSLRLPLHPVIVPLECLLAAFFIAAAWRWHRSRLIRPLVLMGLLAGAGAWLTLADYSGALFPSAADILGPHPDSWSYQAMADYFDLHPRGQVAGMSMVDEFGSHLEGTRFAAPALFAFLHDLPVFADVPTTRVVFTVGCLIVHFFSILALSRVLIGYTNWHMPLLAAFLATAAGWLARAMTAANNDNLIFAALTPALLTVWCAPRADDEDKSAVRWPLVLMGGLLLGALLYNYPEGMALLGVLCLPLFVAILWPGPGGKFPGNRWIEIGSGVVLGILLAMPYLPTFISFLRHQITTGLTIASVLRPNEGIFPGLITDRRLPATFALGEEMRGASYHFINNLVPVCLLVLMILGIRVIGRRQRWFPWIILPLVVLLFWQNIIKHFDYGTFKILLTSSWWIYPAISAGLFWITERYAWPVAWTAALVAALLFTIGLEKYEHRLVPPLTLAGRVKPLQELSTLHFVTGRAPVLLALDDAFDHLWATYYLRDLPLSTRLQRGYLAMPHIAPFLASGTNPPPESCPYMLVTGIRPNALWQNSRFSLLRTLSYYIEDVDNPSNGIEIVDGERYLWVGTQPATFLIYAGSGGSYELSATAFGAGPSMGGKQTATIEITDASGKRIIAGSAATRSLPLTLAPGVNSVSLHCLDTPEPGLHNGDGRELMFAIKGPIVIPVASTEH